MGGTSLNREGAYAIVSSGGKQYRVAAGDTILVEKLDAEAGASVKISEVLLVKRGETEVIVGRPFVKGASVGAKVVGEPVKGEKVVSFKKRRTKGYTKKTGHRQLHTKLHIENIN